MWEASWNIPNISVLRAAEAGECPPGWGLLGFGWGLFGFGWGCLDLAGVAWIWLGLLGFGWGWFAWVGWLPKFFKETSRSKKRKVLAGRKGVSKKCPL